MITTQDLKRAIQDIQDDRDWVNDSHSKSEYMGVCKGLIRLLRHFEEVSEEKNTICIEWGVDDIRSLGYTCTDEKGMEVLDAVKNNHDANHGINWDVLRDYCEQYQLKEKGSLYDCTIQWRDNNEICKNYIIGVGDVVDDDTIFYNCEDIEEFNDLYVKGSSKRDLNSKTPDAISLPEFKVLSYSKI
ncbi:MAG: hypothetical protein CML98_08305 [Rhodobiaceae bacterium]|nr:hypothetical protein [Rhodobiaceae bacterium]|tara:strand:+ start:5083 stop:5643 length:561 start_codon:yes stop_codon:yes gene_type:complete